MSHPARLWLKELFGLWVKLMCSFAGLILSVLGWFVFPNIPQLRPFIVAVGVLTLLFSSYLAWLSKHKALEQKQEELEQGLAKRPVIETGNAPEFDESSSLYRLLVKNTAKTASPITAKIKRVKMGSGEDHPDSKLLPIKLQWMHHPGRDSVPLGEEKVDVAFIQIVPAQPVHSDKRAWRIEDGQRSVYYPIISTLPPELYITIAGVSFHDFKIQLNEGESVYCELAFYGLENEPAKTTWCRFTFENPEHHTAELVPCYPAISN